MAAFVANVSKKRRFCAVIGVTKYELKFKFYHDWRMNISHICAEYAHKISTRLVKPSLRNHLRQQDQFF